MKNKGIRGCSILLEMCLLMMLIFTACNTSHKVPMRRQRPCHDCPTFSQTSVKPINYVCVETESTSC